MNSAWIYAAILLAFASRNAYSQGQFTVDDQRTNRFNPQNFMASSQSGRNPFESNAGTRQGLHNGNRGFGNRNDERSRGQTFHPQQDNGRDQNAAPKQPADATPITPTAGNGESNGGAPPPQQQNGGAPGSSPAPGTPSGTPPAAPVGNQPVTPPGTQPETSTAPNSDKTKAPVSMPQNPLTPTNTPNQWDGSRGCRRVVRRELKDLADSDRRRYWNAIKAIMRRGGGGPSKYDLLAKDHDDYSPLNHGTPMFLVWHRVFLRKFEVAIQNEDSGTAAHYWDWSADAQAPELSIIFSSDWYGGNGDPRRGNCISDGQFSTFQPYYRSSSPCLTRKFNQGNRIGSFVAPEMLSRYVANSYNYDSFRRSLEGQAHSAVHNGVGSGFSTMKSPNDPLFWLHHTFVDKIYMDWQLRDPRRFREVNGGSTGPNTMMRPFNERAILGASTEIYGGCISYAPAVNAFRNRPQRNTPSPPTRDSEWSAPPTNNPGRNGGQRWTSPGGQQGGQWRSPGGRSNGNGRRPIIVRPPIRIIRHRVQRRELGNETVPLEEENTDAPAMENIPSEEMPSVDENLKQQETNSSDSSAEIASINGTNTTVDETTAATNTTLLEVVDHPSEEDIPAMCQDDNGVEVPCPDDRENILDLRAPVPIPDEYMRMNNLNVTFIRAQEAETRKLVEKLNNLDGYVSPCALINREDFLVKLAKKGTEFKQVIHGKVVKVHMNKKTRKSPHQFVENLKQQFSKIGVNVVSSYESVQRGIRRILGKGTEYMRNHFHDQPGTVYYEDEEDDEYCEE